MSGDGYTFLGTSAADVAAHEADTTNVHGITDTSALALTGHAHAGADVTSGTVAYARLPTGTTSSTVAIGDHTHAATGNTPSIPADRGLIAWVFPPFALGSGSTLTTAGTLYLTRIPRVPAGNLTNLHVAVVTQGSVLTSGQCFGALFTAAGALVGQTVDQATAWASVGPKTMALSGGAISWSAGDAYIGLWFNGTTGPSLLRGGSVSTTIANMGLTAPNLAHATANTGLTTAAPNPFTTQTSNGLQFWVAVS